MINRRVTRTVLNSTETTVYTNSPKSDPLTFELLSTDSFYIGFHGKFASRFFQMKTANASSRTVSLDYWNGTAWTPVQDLLDQTDGFKHSGFIHWQNVSDWALKSLSPVVDVPLYWVRLKVSGTLDVNTKLESVLSLLCDDDLVSEDYPELISDDRWLPEGQTDFVPQYLSAKDMVVLRLKQRGLIQDESQIIDVNGVQKAAVHAFATTIYRPLAKTDEMKALYDTARKAFENETDRLSMAVDKNKDGLVSNAERQTVGYTKLVRR